MTHFEKRIVIVLNVIFVIFSLGIISSGPDAQSELSIQAKPEIIPPELSNLLPGLVAR